MKSNKLLLALLAGTMIATSCNSDKTTVDLSTTDSAKMSSMGKDTSDAKMGMDEMHKNGSMSSMTAMMDKMKEIKMTGDFDIDFASMMIEHHQGAIDMSEAELKSGTDEKMKAMAQNIITMQKEEQGKLNAIIKNNKPMKMNMGQGDALNKAMDDMKTKMGDMKMNGNPDKDFAVLMIIHHAGATRMAKDELSYGMKAGLKQMATKMIADQTKEIMEFKSWLATQK